MKKITIKEIKPLILVGAIKEVVLRRKSETVFNAYVSLYGSSTHVVTGVGGAAPMKFKTIHSLVDYFSQLGLDEFTIKGDHHA